MANVNFMIESSKSDLSSKARLVLNCLALHCRKGTDSCFPSLKTIGRETGISRSTVIRAIKELVEVNIVKKVARFTEKKNGGQTSNLYLLNLNFNNEKENEVEDIVVDTEIQESKETTDTTEPKELKDDRKNQNTIYNLEKNTDYNCAIEELSEQTWGTVYDNKDEKIKDYQYKSIINKFIKCLNINQKSSDFTTISKFRTKNNKKNKMPISKGLKWGRVSK